MSYQFDDVNETVAPAPATPSFQGRGGERSYAQEIYSKQINAKFRTFFVDLKQSSNGKFLKISEKSHGRKNTIMMDAEDVPAIMAAISEAQKLL
ncbi:hypothetical protein HZA43_00700 [Candidatus Peregrinibacteria bacterium]|nr:hypothetical protein [Candidatus Peregrinibacteria bacterium]